jgi:hypothetical protein
MAKSDYNVAERPGVTANGGPLTALDRVGETVNVTPDAENRAAATAAGLKDAAFIGYADAAEAHEAREDIESLASRRAREYGSDYDAGAFMRELPNRSGGNGFAPDPDNQIVGWDGDPSTPA